VFPLTVSVSPVRTDIAQALDRTFRRDGFTPIPLALISDKNALAEAGCSSFKRRGAIRGVPKEVGENLNFRAEPVRPTNSELAERASGWLPRHQ